MRVLTFAIALLFTTGCTFGALRHGVVDAVSEAAYRPRPSHGVISRNGQRLELLGGDMHCHVRPPDGEPHVARGLDETVELARRESLDFVVLTPHIRARYYENETTRAAALAAHLALAKRAAAIEDVLLIPGFEYTDYSFGHVGMAFGDLRAAFDAVDPARSARDPDAVFEAYERSGGLFIINHPLLLPVESPLAVSTWDLSWRLLLGLPAPADLVAIDERAAAYEAFNLAITHLRDRFLVGDHRDSLVRVLARFDQRIHETKRRHTPVGGSDSHGHHLRATTFVWSEARSAPAIADAVRAGRTCVRSPEACATSVMVRRYAASPHRTHAIVGDALRGTWFEIANDRANAEVLVNSARVGATTPGRPLRIIVDRDRCSVLRTVVERGYSAPIYLNCPFADRAQPAH